MLIRVMCQGLWPNGQSSSKVCGLFSLPSCSQYLKCKHIHTNFQPAGLAVPSYASCCFPLKCFLSLCSIQPPSYLIYTPGASVSGLKTARRVCLGHLYYYREGKWLLVHGGTRTREFQCCSLSETGTMSSERKHSCSPLFWSCVADCFHTTPSHFI